MASAPSLTRAEASALVQDVQREQVKRSFVRFLAHVQVRSDDPLHPVVTAWQPWPYLLERARAWESGRSEVDVKARQLGWSWLLAAYYAWRARNGWAVGHISAGQLEARELLTRVQFIETHLPPWLQVKAAFRADDAQYPGGGNIHAFPSTDHAGISFTFQLVGMDEAAFHPYGSQNYAAIRPTVSAGGQFLIGSTADPSLGPSGFLHDMYWASKRGETGYDAVFIPWSARPDRDAAWRERERAAFTGLPEEFDAYYPDSDAAAFVGRSGLVYPTWDGAAVREYDPFTWEAAKYRVGGVDFGGGDPTAVVALGVSGARAIHQFEEFYQRGPVTVEQIGAWLMARHRRAPFLRIACDPSQGIAIASLQAAGLPAMAADNDRAGIGVLSSMLDGGRFTIHARNRDSLAEFPGYRWANRTDPNDRTRYATSTPVDNHADAMDARRYALKVIDGMEKATRPRTVTLVAGAQPTVEPVQRMRARLKATRERRSA